MIDTLTAALDACYRHAACADRAAEAAVVALADALAWWYHRTEDGRDDAEAADGVLAALDAVREHDANHPAVLPTRHAVAGIRERYARDAHDEARMMHRLGRYGEAMVAAEAAARLAAGAARDALGHVSQVNAAALGHAARAAYDAAEVAEGEAVNAAALARRRAEATA